jgi:hypothetical protein
LPLLWFYRVDCGKAGPGHRSHGNSKPIPNSRMSVQMLDNEPVNNRLYREFQWKVLARLFTLRLALELREGSRFYMSGDSNDKDSFELATS